MANRKASIWMYVKVGDRWRYVKPVEGRNHKLKAGSCLVDGVEQHHPDATYYIRYREGSKTVWRKCSSAADATVAAERQEAYLAAFAHGLTPKQQYDKAPVPVMMSDVLLAWLEEYRLSHRPESFKLMEATLNEFHGWNRKNLVAKITRVDLLRYRAWCIETQKNEPRTAANKMLRVNQFIRAVLKLDPGKGPVTVKDGKFTELEPTVFNDDELEAFFKECDAFRFAVFKTYLMAGLRKAELENLTWGDVDFTAGVIRITPKKDWQPKTWDARTIEVPDALLTILQELPLRGKLVFANGSGHMYTHSWDDCKKIAKKAKVEDCHPHKFRATFATRNLQNGLDLKTVQALLGHRDIASTMRYLAKAESKKVRAKVNAVWA
jgi:integrase